MAPPILCYVTDRKALPAHPACSDLLLLLRRRIQLALDSGVDWIQIREKDLQGRALFELAASIPPSPAQPRGRIRILINDRLDVACAAGAGGVHLGANSLPVKIVKHWRSQSARADFLIGTSCHSIEDAIRAEHDGADYVFFGPLFHTPSKERFGPPQGLPALAAVCRAVKIPVLAIGGVDLSNAGRCIGAGAAGIAAIRLFQNAPDVAELVNALRR